MSSTGLGAFYKPYLSDSEYETETDSDVDTDGYISEESLCAVPGRYKPVLTAAPAPTNEVVTTPANSGTKFETGESRNTFLFTVDSRNRDTRVYPQPTFFTIRLPRVLKNVKQINISQLTLLNSFFNFTTAKGNTFMYVLEQGRTRTENGIDISNSVRIAIRDGTYAVTDLVTELNNALNAVPLFASITFSNFLAQFQSTGNFRPLFNPPGSLTTPIFNSLTQTYERNQTIDTIVARYFQTVQTVGTTFYTFNQSLVAFYYPVVKEMIIGQPDPVPFSVAGQPIPPGFSSWYDYLVFAFQGLDDPYVTAIVQDSGNQALFDAYRYQNSFNNFLVNKYVATYNDKQGRLVISAPSLNDSITLDLNTTYSNILGNLVLSNGFPSLAAFQTQYNNTLNSNAALTEFYNFIQFRFASYFGVNFGQYSDQFYANLSNEINLYNIQNQYGWNLSFSPSVTATQISSNLPATQVSTFWSNIIVPNTPQNSSFVSTLLVPQFLNNYLEFQNSSEATFGYTDISFSMVPTTYIRTPFKTQCRQNISIMTLPRYFNERSPGTDLTYNLNPSTTRYLYDLQDNLSSFSIRLDLTDTNFYLYNVLQSMFNTAPYMRAFDEWLNYLTPEILAGSRVQLTNPNYNIRPPLGDIVLQSYRPYIFFQMNADEYPVSPDANFNVDFYVEMQDGSPFPVSIIVGYYKDRAAFMADAAYDVAGQYGQENPRHYFQRVVYPAGTTSAVMTIQTNNLDVSYFHVTVENVELLLSAIPIRVFAILRDAYGVYRPSTFFDTLDMPWQGLPPLADQLTPASAVFQDPLRSIYDTAITQIGYDISGVSNNLLDYTIQAGGSNYYDPNNVGDFESLTTNGLRYLFTQGTNGAGVPSPEISSPTTWSLYFGGGGSNVIRDLYNTTSNIYLSSGQTPAPPADPTGNENLLVNWFNPTNPTGLITEKFVMPVPNRISSFDMSIVPECPAGFLSNLGIFSEVGNPTILSISSATFGNNSIVRTTFYPYGQNRSEDAVLFAATFPRISTISPVIPETLSLRAFIPGGGGNYGWNVFDIEGKPVINGVQDNTPAYTTPFQNNDVFGIFVTASRCSWFRNSSVILTTNFPTPTIPSSIFANFGASGGSALSTNRSYTMSTIYSCLIPAYPIWQFSPSSIFQPCVNQGISLVTDAQLVGTKADDQGVSAMGFFLPPNSIVSMDNLLLKFAYTQPYLTSNNIPFTRTNPPFSSQFVNPNTLYKNRTTHIQTSNSPYEDWDDWYVYNRRNLKLGIFRGSEINGVNVSTLALSNALTTMTLAKVSQVVNYTNAAGTLRTREPEWGTYYCYAFDSNPDNLWNVNVAGSNISWFSTNVVGDFAPTYTAGETSNPGYFYTVSTINNYNFLPRGYGIAPSVGYQIETGGTFSNDVNNAFYAVPYFWNSNIADWQVGSFWGLTFTTEPAIAPANQIGAAPYYGPAGVFAMSVSTNANTLHLTSTTLSTLDAYYWNSKITFKTLDAQYNPATDLTAFGGFAGISNELQDTMLFFYSNSAPGEDLRDLSTVNVLGSNFWRWGQESLSNYTAWDDQSGYNFLSYLHDLSVRPTTVEYATHVRAYDPIPSFNTGLRFIGKNITDYGNPTLLEIAQEISSLGPYFPISNPLANSLVLNNATYSTLISTNDAYRSSACISHNYADSLITFNSAFSTTVTFGRRLGTTGTTFAFNGYSTTMATYTTFNSSITSTFTSLTNILSTASGLLNEYVLTRYGSVLPSTIINRNRITDPLPFSLLFGSKTPEPYKSLPDEWGLGWNLGFAKRDTPFRVTITSDTFIRIVQDYIYLRLNPELNVNALAVSGKENLSETRDSAAQDAKYFSKILLSGFGQFSRAAVQLPKQFNPVLGKYDTVICELVDKFGQRINNTDCDYDFVLECSEIGQGPKDVASLVLPLGVNQAALAGASEGATSAARKN